MKNLISVIVPIYNVEKYLDKCIESIINQTHKDLEIILIDDESPDRCPQMCDEWAKKDDRIRVIHKKNGGVSSARNYGLKISTGDYIGFVDPDDYIEPTMYEELLHSLKELDSRMSMCGFSKIKDGEVIKQYNCNDKFIFSEKLLSDIFNEISMGVVWNKLFKKELFLNSNGGYVFFNETIHYLEDVLMLAIILEPKDKIAICNKLLYNYIVVNNSICNSTINEKKLTGLKAMDSIINLCKQKFPRVIDELETLCFNRKIGILNEIYSSNLKNKNEYISNLRKDLKKYQPKTFKYKLKRFILLYIPYIYIIFKKNQKVRLNNESRINNNN